MPDNATTEMVKEKLSSFVIKIAEKENATPDELRAMAEIAHILLGINYL